MTHERKPTSLDYARPPRPSLGRQLAALFCSTIVALLGLPAIAGSIFVLREAWTGPSADFLYHLQGGLCLLLPGVICLIMAWRWGRVGFRG